MNIQKGAMNGFPKMWNIQKGVWQGAHTSHLLMVKRDMGRRSVEYNWLVIFGLASVVWVEKGKWAVSHKSEAVSTYSPVEVKASSS